MCYSCVLGFADGQDVPFTEEMLTVMEATRAIYDTKWGGTGGPLHVFLDDYNLEDHWFVPDLAQAFEIAGWMLEWYDLSVADVQLVWRCWDALVACTEAQRALAVELAHSPGDPPALGARVRATAEALTVR